MGDVCYIVLILVSFGLCLGLGKFFERLSR